MISGPPAVFPANPNLSIPAKGDGKLEAGYASGPISPGKSVTVTLVKAGTYEIGCAFHYGEGMRDVLVVKNGAKPGPQATPPSPKVTPRTNPREDSAHIKGHSSTEVSMESQSQGARTTKLLYTCAAALFVASCSGGVSAPPLTPLRPTSQTASRLARNAVGLGKILSSDDGQIFGFDIDRNGNDGALATSTNVQTFDQNSGAILNMFPKSPPSGTSYNFDAIVTGDVGLVTRDVMPKGSPFAKRFYDLMDPVKGSFIGKWTPPVKDIEVEAAGPNQTTGMTAIFAIELKKNDIPDLFESNVAKNEFGKVFHLNPRSFGVGNLPQVAQDTATNEAVIATSPDGGKVQGARRSTCSSISTPETDAVHRPKQRGVWCGLRQWLSRRFEHGRCGHDDRAQRASRVL